MHLLLALLLAAPAFREVDPGHSSAAFRGYLAAALARLESSRAAIGRATFAVISSGRVKVDELTDLKKGDFTSVRESLRGWGIDVDARAFARLHDRRTSAARTIEKNLAGYTSTNRIYVARGQTRARLASTLVHEVNHFLNDSEKHYRTQKGILREEYRAFYAEKLLSRARMDRAACRALKAKVIKDYQLKRVTPDDVPDVPPGILVPR